VTRAGTTVLARPAAHVDVLPERSVRRDPWGWGFGALVVAAIAWRGVVLSSPGRIVGVDFGNWLALGRAVGSGHVSGSDAVYPPVVPLLARAAVALVGVPTGAAAIAAVAAVCPAIGVFLALRPPLGGAWATGAASVLLLAGATSAAAAWGGIPQLLGLLGAPLAAVAAAELVVRPGWRPAGVLGALMLGVALVSPLVFGLTAAAVLLALASSSAIHRTLRWLPHALVACAALLPVVPLYVTFVSRARIGATDLATSGIADVFNHAVGGTPLAWLALGFVALTAPLCTWSSRSEQLWAASSAMLVVSVITLLAADDPRFSALAPVAIVVACAWLGARAARPVARICVPALALAAVVVAFRAPAVMHDHRVRYARLVPAGTAQLITWIDAHTAPSDRFVVAPVEGAPFGWLVEGWAQRPSFVGGDPSWLAFPGERRRAAEATDVLTGVHWPQPRAFSRARHLGAKWIYLPSGWGGTDHAALAAAARTHAGLVAYQGRGGVVLRVPPRTGDRG
jgi:hypothetical protein